MAERSDGIALRYLFDTPWGVLKDEIYGFTAENSSIYIPAYQRGIYFTGNRGTDQPNNLCKA